LPAVQPERERPLPVRIDGQDAIAGTLRSDRQIDARRGFAGPALEAGRRYDSRHRSLTSEPN
jgi:hypothetical protein